MAVVQVLSSLFGQFPFLTKLFAELAAIPARCSVTPRRRHGPSWSPKSSAAEHQARGFVVQPKRWIVSAPSVG